MNEKIECADCKHFNAETDYCKRSEVTVRPRYGCYEGESRIVTNGDRIRQMSDEELGKMNKLESLVPPLELCKMIPEGAFADSALVWNEDDTYPGASAILSIRDNRIFTEGWRNFPAPTLQEILEALDVGGHICITCIKEYNTWKVECEEMPEIERDSAGYPVIDIVSRRDSINPATAALKLWMEVNGE